MCDHCQQWYHCRYVIVEYLCTKCLISDFQMRQFDQKASWKVGKLELYEMQKMTTDWEEPACMFFSQSLLPLVFEIVWWILFHYFLIFFSLSLFFGSFQFCTLTLELWLHIINNFIIVSILIIISVFPWHMHIFTKKFTLLKCGLGIPS